MDSLFQATRPVWEPRSQESFSPEESSFPLKCNYFLKGKENFSEFSPEEPTGAKTLRLNVLKVAKLFQANFESGC